MSRKLAPSSPEKDILTTKPCHCGEILKLVLWPLTQHCLIAGENACAFYYLLEAAAASLDLSDNYMVSKPCSVRPSRALSRGGFSGFLTIKLPGEESGRERIWEGFRRPQEWGCGGERAPGCRPAPALRVQSSSRFYLRVRLTHVQISTLLISLLRPSPLWHCQHHRHPNPVSPSFVWGGGLLLLEEGKQSPGPALSILVFEKAQGEDLSVSGGRFLPSSIRGEGGVTLTFGYFSARVTLLFLFKSLCVFCLCVCMCSYKCGNVTKGVKIQT